MSAENANATRAEITGAEFCHSRCKLLGFV